MVFGMMAPLAIVLAIAACIIILGISLIVFDK